MGQVAVELPNEDIYLLLLKFGGDPNKRTASRAQGAMYDSGETPVQMLKRLMKEHDGKDQGKCDMFTRMLLWSEDEKKRDEAAELMMPRLTKMEEEEREAGLSLSGQ